MKNVQRGHRDIGFNGTSNWQKQTKTSKILMDPRAVSFSFQQSHG
jgi:hypothetical protein